MSKLTAYEDILLNYENNKERINSLSIFREYLVKTFNLKSMEDFGSNMPKSTKELASDFYKDLCQNYHTYEQFIFDEESKDNFLSNLLYKHNILYTTKKSLKQFIKFSKSEPDAVNELLTHGAKTISYYIDRAKSKCYNLDDINNLLYKSLLKLGDQECKLYTKIKKQHIKEEKKKTNKIEKNNDSKEL